MAKLSDQSENEPLDSNIVFLSNARKADTSVVVNDLLEIEDSFEGLYFNKNGEGAAAPIIEPPYNPSQLFALSQRNNILSQCIQAMEVSIDGTGHSFDKIDPEGSDDEKEKKRLEDFFGEPFPEESFIHIRRQCRVDMEASGNGYMEVLRNITGDIVMLRYLDALNMRLVRLDEPVQVEKVVVRDGKELKAKVFVRERRFVQKFGTKLIYFKEFGSSRELHRETGKWSDTKLPPEDRASEVIHFTLLKDPRSPYGVPRWINQLPSVLGSRKAEEFNLDFFDAGGLPPAIVFIQGGAIVGTVKEQLVQYLSGKAGQQHRGAVVEVQSTSGSLDSAGSVQVKVERFGGDRTKDAMFQEYDNNCEEHVRISFRLPPMFIGRSQDYNFATALTSYMLAEAQVFQPERLEFDEIINTKILKAMGIKTYKFRSTPVSLKDAELQLKALEFAQQVIDGEELVSVVNEISGLNLNYSAEAEKTNQQLFAKNPLMGGVGPDGQPVEQPSNVVPIKPAQRAKEVVAKSELAMSDIVALTDLWCLATGLTEGESLPEDLAVRVVKAADGLEGNNRKVFESLLAAKMFANVGVDREGLADIAGCCAEHMHHDR